MKTFATVKPAINQIQVNMKKPNTELLQLLDQEGITPVAWGPMKATDEQKEALAIIGENYGKSWGQVLLKYQVQREIVVIPKSHSHKNQKANLNIFDFELTQEEIDHISTL